jgi:hypothetical protein
VDHILGILILTGKFIKTQNWYIIELCHIFRKTWYPRCHIIISRSTSQGSKAMILSKQSVCSHIIICFIWLYFLQF